MNDPQTASALVALGFFCIVFAVWGEASGWVGWLLAGDGVAAWSLGFAWLRQMDEEP